MLRTILFADLKVFNLNVLLKFNQTHWPAQIKVPIHIKLTQDGI